jgi:hypothetical protein
VLVRPLIIPACCETPTEYTLSISIVLPRIVSPKPLKFLNSAIDSILSTLTTLAENDAFYVSFDVYNEPSQIEGNVNNSVKMIQCIIRLILKVRSNRWIIDQDLVRYSASFRVVKLSLIA